MYLRRYQCSDLKEIIKLFRQTVTNINVRDYTPLEIKAWTTSSTNFIEWDLSLSQHYSLVAIENNRIVGFGDINEFGYLDRLYVHYQYQKHGIGTALCDALEKKVQGDITTNASITAKSFFEKSGYQVLKEQKVLRNGVYLINFRMKKQR